MGKLKLAAVLLVLFALPACAHYKKLIAKNCDQTKTGEFYVCDRI